MIIQGKEVNSKGNQPNEKNKKVLDRLPNLCYNKYVTNNKSQIVKEIDTMEEKKMTKKDYFNQLLAIENVKGNEALVNFINHELELIAKKNSKERKPTTNQAENEKLKAELLKGMEVGKGYTVTEMQKTIPAMSEYSNQRISALLRQLISENLVTREEIKRKATFTKVG